MGKEWDALLEFIATFYGSLRELYFTEKGDTLLSEASNISLPPFLLSTYPPNTTTLTHDQFSIKCFTTMTCRAPPWRRKIKFEKTGEQTRTPLLRRSIFLRSNLPPRYEIFSRGIRGRNRVRSAINETRDTIISTRIYTCYAFTTVY